MGLQQSHTSGEPTHWLICVAGVAYGLHGVAGTDNSDSAVIDPQTLIVSTAAEAQVGPHATSQAGKSPAANTSCPAPVVSTSRTWFSQAWHNCNNVDAKEQQACINTWAQQLMKLEGQECEATANGPTCQDCINIWWVALAAAVDGHLACAACGN